MQDHISSFRLRRKQLLVQQKQAYRGPAYVTTTKKTGYEPNGQEKTVYAHFAAPGLVNAAVEALQSFPLNVLNQAVKKDLQKNQGVLTSTSSLVSTRILNLCFGLSGHFHRFVVRYIFMQMAWDSETSISIQKREANAKRVGSITMTL